MKASNCCGASICEETDICCKCKEHCRAIDAEFESLQMDLLNASTPEEIAYFQNLIINYEMEEK